MFFKLIPQPRLTSFHFSILNFHNLQAVSSSLVIEIWISCLQFCLLWLSYIAIPNLYTTDIPGTCDRWPYYFSFTYYYFTLDLFSFLFFSLLYFAGKGNTDIPFYILNFMVQLMYTHTHTPQKKWDYPTFLHLLTSFTKHNIFQFHTSSSELRDFSIPLLLQYISLIEIIVYVFRSP